MMMMMMFLEQAREFIGQMSNSAALLGGI